jgi:membrane protein YqaA with SNARE-associated domain
MPPTQEQRRQWLSYLGRAAALAGVIALSLFIFSIRDEVERFARFGYAGIFVFSLLSYATVILPVPGVAVVFAMGAVFNPLWVGMAAGAGAALGELTGYAVGLSGETMIENVGLYRRVRNWMKHSRWRAFVGLVVLSAVPNPLADFAGVAAGVLRIPIPQFLSALLIGETIKMWMFAYAGAYSQDWIMRFFA